MPENFRIRKVDHQGNERTEHDEVRGVGKAFTNWAALGGGGAYPATKLDFILPDTGGATPFGVTAVKRDATKQLASLLTIHIVNKEADNRDFIFYDGNPGGAADTFQQLITTVTVLAGSSVTLTEQQLKGYIATFDLYVDPSGNKTNGVEVSVSALIVNKEVAE